MATRSLSPNRVAQQLREHRQAVMVLARQAAKKAVKERPRSQGVRVTLVLPKDINVLANDYLAEHCDVRLSTPLRLGQGLLVSVCQVHSERMSPDQPVPLCKYQVRNDRRICTSEQRRSDVGCSTGCLASGWL